MPAKMPAKKYIVSCEKQETLYTLDQAMKSAKELTEDNDTAYIVCQMVRRVRPAVAPVVIEEIP